MLTDVQNPREMCHAAPKAGSLTHQHLLAVINTELVLRNPSDARPVRILDVGCGDGLLLEFLSKALPACWPTRPFEFFGFDVSDHGVQKPGFLVGTIEHLTRSSPSHPWGERITSISDRASWPYESGTFDVVLSNQVVEHVFNHELFFHEIARVLRVGGFSVHLFPLRHCIREPHLHIPFAHWLRSSEVITSYIKMCSLLGIGKYRKTLREDGSLYPLHDYAKRHADYIIRNTNYLTQRKVFDIVKATKLHASFRYSDYYYTEKLRSLAGRRPTAFYGSSRAFSSSGVILLRYIASITLLLERDESYQA
jgi:SAM-dependent methyltransferase